MTSLHIITDASWEQDVATAPGLVLVDFWAAWCGPCKAMLPTVAEIADEYAGDVKVGKLNVDENPQAAAAVGVRSIPLLVLYRQGVELERAVGAMSKTALANFIEKHH